MTARMELFLLCFVIPIALTLILTSWQDRRRARKRRAIAMQRHIRKVIEERY